MKYAVKIYSTLGNPEKSSVEIETRINTLANHGWRVTQAIADSGWIIIIMEKET